MRKEHMKNCTQLLKQVSEQIQFRDLYRLHVSHSLSFYYLGFPSGSVSQVLAHIRVSR